MIRIVCVDITNDEAYSFHNIKKFWYAEFLCTGNSHWFNSAAMALSAMLNLEQNYYLRWLNFISAIIFVFVILKWTKTLNGHFSKIFALCLLLLNPYVLDYFVLARGYALSISMECLSLFLLISSIKQKKQLMGSIALALACVSAISQYSFLYYLIAFGIIYFYLNYFNKNFGRNKNWFFYIDGLVLLSTFTGVFLAIRFISRCSNDYLGAGTNSFQNALNSFFVSVTYNNFNLNNYLVLAISVIAMLFVLTSLYWAIAKVRHQNIAYYYSSVILVIMFCIILVAKFCFVGVFPEGRSALFLFPLIAINLIYFFDSSIKNVFFQNTLMLVLSILLGINFILSYNLNKTHDYFEQSETNKMYKFIEKEGAVNLGVSGELYGVYTNYYQLTQKLRLNFKAEVINSHQSTELCKQNNYLFKFDHLLLFPPYNLSFYKNSHIKVSAVKMFEPNKVLLLKVGK